jgi:oxygen-independent coproporphyrinogen-3 oxidase
MLIESTVESPDSPALADRAAAWAAAYVHIPFCARLCPYCDFAVVTGQDSQISRYVDALCREIDTEWDWRELDAVYFGGGTPSRMQPELLGRIVLQLQRRFGIRNDAEVSLEANPEDWSPIRAEALREAGFNRVSFGGQSFSQRTLRALGRRHEPAQIESAVAIAKASGFSSVNLDLIYGTPGENLSEWKGIVDRAISLGLDHLSCYALTVERGTALFRQVAAGEPAPDPDLQADEWEAADDLATSHGLVRYEVSNWARTDHPVRYNLAVWAQAEFVAFGLGAHRFRRGERSHNFRTLERYLQAVESGNRPLAGAEQLAGWNREVERVFLGLRRAAGVRIGESGAALLASDEGERLQEAGVLGARNGRIVVNRPLLTDAVSRAVLALSAPDC